MQYSHPKVERAAEMTDQDLFSKGFSTNRIPIVLPSTGRSIVLRETTVTELKSIAKTIIDNFNRR
jgi:hypothetical protein